MDYVQKRLKIMELVHLCIERNQITTQKLNA